MSRICSPNILRAFSSLHRYAVTYDPVSKPSSAFSCSLNPTVRIGGRNSPSSSTYLAGALRVTNPPICGTITQSLSSNNISICFTSSFTLQNYAFSGGHCSCLRKKFSTISPHFVKSANALAVGDCIPDLTILLDVPAELGLERARVRDGGYSDRMGSEKLEFYESVRRGFLKIAQDNPERFALVDGAPAPEKVAQEIRKIVEARFNV